MTSALDRRLTFVTAILVSLVCPWSFLFSDDHHEEFESLEASWKVLLNPRDSKIDLHQRRRDSGKSGGAEYVRIISSRENSRMRLEHSVPEAIVLDELEVSLWVKSEREGLTLKVKVVLPESLDPETRRPLSFLIKGDKYDTTNQWQQLKCRTTERAVNEQLRLLRANKKITAAARSLVVDRVILDGELPPGTSEFLLDSLALSPLVPPSSNESKNVSNGIQPASQTLESPDSSTAVPAPRVQFDLHRFYINDKPFYPRMVTGHGERPEVLCAAGINVLFLPNYDDTRVAMAMRRHGVFLTSTPPFAKGADGEALDAEDANLLPFQADTSSVLFWMLGSRMTPDGRPRLTSWTTQIRNADRLFNKRPIAADVIENERLCSRHVDLLGISWHVIHSNCSLVEYRNGIIQRRNQAWPDSFIWTWIQTEPAPALLDLARSLESPPMLEPEQIRLQVYAALAAGCRGIGYWTKVPLDDDSPAARERLLIMTQLNMELDLFEPWITSGSPQLISFHVDPSATEVNLAAKQAAQAAGKAAAPRRKRGQQPEPKNQANALPPPRPAPRRTFQAAVFRTDRGALILPAWTEDNAQFVPGAMAAKNVSIVVPGGGDTAAAWEITTTGQLQHLNREPTVGGVKIKIPRFDQTAAILMTSDQTIVDELNQKALSIQDQSAHIIVELAKLKLDRVRRIHQSLPREAVPRPDDAQSLLGQARLRCDESESALRGQRYAEARLFATESMEYLRLLQRTDWDQSVKRLSCPTASPWAVSYQSLPDHWRLMKQLDEAGSLEKSENLLPSGEFEDTDTLIAGRWKFEQLTTDAVDSSADLHGGAKQGRCCLRLLANPSTGEAPPNLISQPLLHIVSPGVRVHTGQVIKITGWVKIPKPIRGSIDGAVIYDSLLGKPGAIRLKGEQDWKRFEVIRPVPESQELTVTIALQGLGEFLVDDLKIVAFEPPEEIASPSPNQSAIAPAKYSTLDSLRRLNPLPKRR